MKITSDMLVPDTIPSPGNDDGTVLKECPECGERSWFVPQRVLVFSPGGSRSMRLWVCEKHPLPDQVTDQTID